MAVCYGVWSHLAKVKTCSKKMKRRFYLNKMRSFFFYTFAWTKLSCNYFVFLCTQWFCVSVAAHRASVQSFVSPCSRAVSARLRANTLYWELPWKLRRANLPSLLLLTFSFPLFSFPPFVLSSAPCNSCCIIVPPPPHHGTIWGWGKKANKSAFVEASSGPKKLSRVSLKQYFLTVLSFQTEVIKVASSSICLQLRLN